MSPDTAADTAVASPPPPTNGNGDAQVEFIPKYSKYRIFTNQWRVEGCQYLSKSRYQKELLFSYLPKVSNPNGE